MDRAPDGPYEILDFGRGSGPATDRIDSDVGGSDLPPNRKLRRWASLGIAVLVGVVLGANGWHEWSDHRAALAERSTVALVGGVTSASPRSDGTVIFSIVLENLGATPVRVDEMLVAGWPRPVGREPLRVEIPRGGSEAVWDMAIVRCATQPPNDVSARVKTADGVSRTVPIRLPGDRGSFAWPHSVLCESSGRAL